MPDSRQPVVPARPAETTTLRLLVVGVAVSVLVSAIATFAVADTHGRAAVPGWLGAIIGLAFAVLVLVGAAAPWLGARALRCGAAAGVALFFVALLLFAPASGVLTGTASSGTVPWSLTAIGGILIAAVAAGGARAGWLAIIVWVAVVAWYRVVLGGYTLNGLANDAQALTTAATLCAISAHALQTSRDLDAAAARAETAVALEGAERGRFDARARVASFVHDEVLAALRGAAEGRAGTAEAVRAQARRASVVIVADRGVHDWIERLGVLADAAGAALRIERAANAVTPTPEVGGAIVVASRQALENSIRHAGECTRRVEISLEASGVTVRIIDDGGGFSPTSIAPGRLGIATSILGPLQAVVGAGARVDSQQGRGTTVELFWREPVEFEGDDDLAAHTARAESTFPRATAFVVVSLFVVTQTVVAVAAAAAVLEGAWWTPLLVLAGLLAAAALAPPTLRGRATRAPVAVALVCVTVGGALLATPAPLSYGSAWFLPAAAFVLVTVALAARSSLALAGLVVIVLTFIIDAVVRGGDPSQLAAVVIRTTTIVGLGTLLSISIVRMRRSTRALARRAVRTTQQREWDAAARRELESHADEVDQLAGPLLARIAAGETLDAEERARAGAIEGRLRDGYRAGRLLRAPLNDAAMRARLRGVDVVLLDDAAEREVDAATAAAVTEWMRPQLDVARERFIGRLLPPGRSATAQVVVDGRAQSFEA